MQDQPTAVRIPLRRRDGTVAAYALVDQEFVGLADVRWSLSTSGYAVRRIRIRVDGAGRQQHVRLHRVVLGLKADDPREGDHINGDRLDNRRSNLRVVPRGANQQNVGPGRGSSRFRGVSWHKASGKWNAYVGLNGRRSYLGLFVSEEEAAEAASAWRLANMPFTNEERRR